MREKSLKYHSEGRRGKIEVVPSKPCKTQEDLSLAYTPGVANPVLEIEKNPGAAGKYTARNNLVAVVTNGSAILGLGNRGALASKPVMEGKAILFKRFADIDVFDIELDTQEPGEIIKACQLMEPTFGGINLEDIKAPECFLIEEELKRTMSIPIFHDDQHGTAIISGAGLINGLELAGKKASEVRMVVNGAGASGIACAKFALSLGVKKEKLMMLDSKGVIYSSRKEGMNDKKEYFALDTPCRTLADAMEGADVFLGNSVGGVVHEDMIKSMAAFPVVFAMANPDPEIDYNKAKSARPDILMATGRSDFPNQINNVMGFPFIFRGALDVMARTINEEMKIAAANALARLAKEKVPPQVSKAYGGREFSFGQDYIIPKPFDPRILIEEASAVAEAAMKSGVAEKNVNIAEYKKSLEVLSEKINKKYG